MFQHIKANAEKALLSEISLNECKYFHQNLQLFQSIYYIFAKEERIYNIRPLYFYLKKLID